MNRYQVAESIRDVGSDFGRVMAVLHSEEYVAGYEQAIRDMVRMFECKSFEDDMPPAKRVVLFGGTKGRRL